MKYSVFFSLSLWVVAAQAQLSPNGATASFKGSLPPKPTAALSAEQEGGIAKELAEVTKAFQAVKKHPRAADADIFLKAVRYALEFHEWYDKKPEDGVKKATALLEEAKKRIAALGKNETPWMNGSGQKVLGFSEAAVPLGPPLKVFVPKYRLPAGNDGTRDPGLMFWANFPINRDLRGQSLISPIKLESLARAVVGVDMQQLELVCGDLRKGGTLAAGELLGGSRSAAMRRSARSFRATLRMRWRAGWKKGSRLAHLRRRRCRLGLK